MHDNNDNSSGSRRDHVYNRICGNLEFFEFLGTAIAKPACVIADALRQWFDQTEPGHRYLDSDFEYVSEAIVADYYLDHYGDSIPEYDDRFDSNDQ